MSDDGPTVKIVIGPYHTVGGPEYEFDVPVAVYERIKRAHGKEGVMYRAALEEWARDEISRHPDRLFPGRAPGN